MLKPCGIIGKSGEVADVGGCASRPVAHHNQLGAGTGYGDVEQVAVGPQETFCPGWQAARYHRRKNHYVALIALELVNRVRQKPFGDNDG